MFPKPGTAARKKLDEEAARTPMMASWAEGETGAVRAHGVEPTRAVVRRWQRLAELGSVEAACVAAVLELQRVNDAYMERRPRAAREAQALEWWPAVLEKPTDPPIIRDRRGKRWADGMEMRAIHAEVDANPYSRGEVHPYEGRYDIREAFAELSRRERAVWRRQCSACFSEGRPWQRWPTYMQPPQTGGKGKALRKSKKTPPADDAAHVFGEVHAARVTFEAFETNAEQVHAVRFFELAEGSAPSWAKPRGCDRPGPRPRRRLAIQQTKASGK